jgi:GNAT superfamily N-acetyltransferase
MIRQFRPEDAPSCSALILACLKNDPAYSPALLQKILRSETPEAMVERAAGIYVAVCEIDGEIRGVAGLEMNEIRLLYVAPGCRRQGIGRNLLEHLESMVPRALFSDAFVYTTKQAVAFYQACGFTDGGPFLFDLEGEKLQTVFMTLPIH